MTIVTTPYTGPSANVHTITFPAPTAGRKLLLAFVSGAAAGVPPGWSQIGVGVGFEGLYLWERTATGSETQAVVTLSGGAARAAGAVVIERDDCGPVLAGGSNGDGAVSGTSVTGRTGTFNAAGTAVVVGVIGRAATTITGTLTSVPVSPWAERADVAYDAATQEDPWLTVVDRVDVPDGAYTPQVTTSATLPLSACQAITVAFEYVPPALPPFVGDNPTHTENALTGNPSSEWQVTGAGDTTCMGYAAARSYPAGGSAQFKIHNPSGAASVEVFRLGWYGGAGARKVATVTAAQTTQPAGTVDPTTLALDCGNWTVNATWAIPADACPGLYLARPKIGPQATHIVFAVRNPARKAAVAVLLPDATWDAYNYYGGPGAELAGRSLYGQSGGFNLANRAYAVSLNRPHVTRGTIPQTWLFNSEYPLVRFLERCGYDVDYLMCTDVDADPTLLLGRRVVIVSGHNEYWSTGIRDAMETARDQVSPTGRPNLVVMAGNEAFWRTRYDAGRRTMTCYKDTMGARDGSTAPGAALDPVTWTGTWQDTRWSGRRPPSALVGQSFIANGIRTDTITVPAGYQARPMWRNCSWASGTALTAGSLGMEWDAPALPEGVEGVQLSETAVDITGFKSDANGQVYNLAGIATHGITLYRAASGALVAGLGTTQWSWALDATHDRGSAAADPRAQQATLNLLADLGVIPPAASLPAGLVLPVAVDLATYGFTTVTPPGEVAGQRSYATAAQYATWLGLDTAPAGSTRLLAAATRVVDRHIVTAVYAVAGAAELPSDTAVATALREAVCAQVEAWQAAGTSHLGPGAAGWGQITAGRITLARGAGSSAAAAGVPYGEGLAGQAYAILAQAGLIGHPR